MIRKFTLVSRISFKTNFILCIKSEGDSAA